MPDRTELLKLKLDLVYRGKDRETVRTQFQEKTDPTKYQEVKKGVPKE